MSELQERVDATTQVFQQWVQNQGYRITPDGRVDAQTAAQLLGVSEGHLRNLRSAHGGPAHIKARGRVSYRLHDLAQWLEAGRCESLDIAVFKTRRI